MESNWPAVKLEELLEQNTTTEKLEPEESYRLLGVRLEGKGPFIREEKPGSQIRAKSLRKVSSGEFIYSRLFAWRGAFGLISPEMDCAFVSNEFPTFKIDEQQVFPKFLEIYFKQRWVWTEVEKYCTGTTKASRNRFKEKFFLNLDIPLPAKEEQKHIVARIESLLAKIEEARRLRAEAVIEVEKAIKSILRKIFLNDGWITNKLGDVCDTTSGGTPSRERPDFFNGEIPWLKSGELNDTLIVDSEERITEEGLQNSNAKIFTRGTLLIALYGATTGKTGILGVDAATNQAICAIFPNKNIIEGDYLHWFLRFKRDDYLLKSFGGAQPNISQKLLKETKIPIPPLPEQRRIVAYLDSLQAKMDELKRLQAETEKEIEELVPSILDRAFKGEL